MNSIFLQLMKKSRRAAEQILFCPLPMTAGPIPENSLPSQPCLVDSLYLELFQQQSAHGRQENKTKTISLVSGQTWVLILDINCVMHYIYKPHFLQPKKKITITTCKD